jgi:DNA end-binding protein Ku
VPARKADPKQVKMAQQLIESLHSAFAPGKLHDEYRETVLDAIRRKAKGEDVAGPEDPAQESGDDLMAALQASLGGSR